MPSRNPLPITRGLPCSHPGCTALRVAGSAARYCSRHRNNHRKNGDPGQEAISIAQVRKWERDVRWVYRRLPKTNREKLSQYAEIGARGLRELLQAIVKGQEPSQASRHHKDAAAKLLRVLDQVSALDVFTRASAVFLMRQEQPYLFRSDAAFRAQLVRAVRKLASIADGQQWDAKNQRVRHVTRRVPIKVRQIMETWLVELTVPWAANVVACRKQVANLSTVNAQLAADIFGPLKERLAREHAKAERKLALAQRLHQGETP